MYRPRNFVLLVVLSLLFGLALSWCGQKSSPPQKPQANAPAQKPKAPQAAEAILKDINTLIGELDKQNKTTQAPWMSAASSSASQSGQSKGSNNQGSGSSGQTGASGSAQGGKQGPGGSSGQTGSSSGSSGGSASGNAGGTVGHAPLSPEKQQQQSWQKIGQSLLDIHKKWNELEPEVMTAGLPTSSVNEFEETLGLLTQSVSAQKNAESLTAAIALYDRYTVGISQVFTLSTPPEFYQVQYRTMAALAAAGRQDWAAASDSIDAALEPWGLLKAQAKKADPKLLERCDYSLQDLKTAISEQDLNMLLIKGDIARGNLQQLEKSLTRGGAG